MRKKTAPKEPFNAKAARAKRPCPIWWDAFLRDTMHLDAAGVGAYLLVLAAMWGRESCGLPNDDKQLAIIARVSLKAWRGSLGHNIRAFLVVDDAGEITSKRLRTEAEYVEKHLQKQSDRRSKGSDETFPEGTHDDFGHAFPGDDPDGHEYREANEDDNHLKDNDRASSADTTADPSADTTADTTADITADITADPSADDPRTYPRHPPTYNPTTQHKDLTAAAVIPDPARGQSSSFLQRVLDAVGLNPNDVPSTYWMPHVAEAHVARWAALPGLTEASILEHIRRRRAELGGPPPNGPKAYDDELGRLSRRLVKGRDAEAARLAAWGIREGAAAPDAAVVTPSPVEPAPWWTEPGAEPAEDDENPFADEEEPDAKLVRTGSRAGDQPPSAGAGTADLPGVQPHAEGGAPEDRLPVRDDDERRDRGALPPLRALGGGKA